MPKGQPTTCSDTKICAGCGNEFSRNGRSCSYFNARMACSLACRSVLAWRKREHERREASVAATPSKLCQACGKTITRHANESPGRFARRNTCGYRCSGPKINRERQQRLYGDINQLRFCAYCGKRLQRRSGESNGSYFTRQTCGFTCGCKFAGLNKRRPEEQRQSLYAADFTTDLKARIRARDGNVCRLCGATPSSRALDCHHIDYDKRNTDESNLISLCRSCHSKTNYQRDYWPEIFRAMLNKEIAA